MSDQDSEDWINARDISAQQRQISFGGPASEHRQPDAGVADQSQAALGEESGLRVRCDAERRAFAPPPGLSAPLSSSTAPPFTAASEGDFEAREPSVGDRVGGPEVSCSAERCDRPQT